MKFKIFIATFLMFICISMAYADETKIAKINLGLLTALHPKMALFDFGALGFYKFGFGLSEDEIKKEINDNVKNGKVVIKAQEDFEQAKKQLEILENQNYNYLKDGRCISKEIIDKNKIKKIWEMNMINAKYSMQYPYLTPPKETMRLLKQIEEEINETICEYAKQKEYDLVLNITTPVPFGYPISYRDETSFYIGPNDIDAFIYYAVLSYPTEDRNEKTIAEDSLRTWFAGINKPQIQKYLPMAPRPIVLQGGNDILLDVLRIIYKKNKIKDEFYNTVKDSIIKFGVIEK